jgi:hypothetical protein
MISGKIQKIRLRLKDLRTSGYKTLNADRSSKPLGSNLTLRSMTNSTLSSLIFTSGARLPMAIFPGKSNLLRPESMT